MGLNWLGHKVLNSALIDTHVLNRSPLGVRNPVGLVKQQEQVVPASANHLFCYDIFTPNTLLAVNSVECPEHPWLWFAESPEGASVFLGTFQ